MTTAALEVQGLAKSFGGLPVITNVSITVPQGQRRLLLGPNGAGKTTLFKLIAGEIKSDGGSVRLFGRDIGRLRADRRARMGLGRTFQIITLFQRDTLLHNVALALLGASATRWNFLRPLSHYEPELRERGLELLDSVGLAAHADRPLSQSSYGEQRRLEIAVALAQRPRVLLLDEPFAGLSSEERNDVQAVLAAIPRDVTMVIIEHDMDVALSLADQITALYYGEVLVEGTREEIVADDRIREIYLGV